MTDKKHLSPFEKEIVRADRQLRNVCKLMDETRKITEDGDINGAYLKAFELADASEKLTLITRQLPAYTGRPRALKETEKVIEKNIPMKVGFTPEGWFGVVIPALLPKKGKGSADYIRENLYLSLERFFRGKQPVRYTACVLIFRHVYQRSRPEREYRDHDNIELNMAVDAISLYVLHDDAPTQCSHYYCSASGDENQTEIFVVPQSEFIEWICAAKKSKGREILLLNSLP